MESGPAAFTMRDRESQEDRSMIRTKLDRKHFVDKEAQRANMARLVLDHCSDLEIKITITSPDDGEVETTLTGVVGSVREGFLHVALNNKFLMPMSAMINIPLSLIEDIIMDTSVGILEIWVVNAGDLVESTDY